MANRDDITPEILRQLLRYEEETGKLFWLPRGQEWFADGRQCAAWNTRWANKQAFTNVKGNGYLSGNILGMSFYAHRVGWAIATGEWPRHEVDHLNGQRSDNRLENLRDASPKENQRNQKRSSRNTSGDVGVYWHKRAQKWAVQIFPGKAVWLGLFPDKASAVKARKDAETSLGFHPNHGRSQ
jgi:hypothetical protein